jgi:hypothetical protein
MASPNAWDEAVAEELSKVGMKLASERYPHETNDEYGYRLIALIEDAIDEHETKIAQLDRVYQAVKALL